MGTIFPYTDLEESDMYPDQLIVVRGTLSDCLKAPPGHMAAARSSQEAVEVRRGRRGS